MGYNAVAFGTNLYNYNKGKMSYYDFMVETASTLVASSMGEYDPAWILGWESGRTITQTKSYQRTRFQIFYYYLEMMYGPPIEGNHKIWINEYEYYLNTYYKK